MSFWIPRLANSVFLKQKGVVGLVVVLEQVVAITPEVLTGNLMIFIVQVSFPSVLGSSWGYLYFSVTICCLLSGFQLKSESCTRASPSLSWHQGQLLVVPWHPLLVRLDHGCHPQSFSRRWWDSGYLATGPLLTVLQEEIYRKLSAAFCTLSLF